MMYLRGIIDRFKKMSLFEAIQKHEDMYDATNILESEVACLV